MTHPDPHREALHAAGLTDEQIDAALATMGAQPYVDPYDQPPTDGRPAEAMAGAHKYPGDPVTIDSASFAEVQAGAHVEPPKWTCEQPPSAFLNSLNGFDEIAITGRFGAPILALRDDPITGGRALAFVHMRRLGANDADAYTQSMTLTMQEVMDYFHPEPKPASAEGN